MTKNYAGAEVILTLGVQAFFDGGKRLLLQWSVPSNSLSGRIPARRCRRMGQMIFNLPPPKWLCVLRAYKKAPKSSAVPDAVLLRAFLYAAAAEEAHYCCATGRENMKRGYCSWAAIRFFFHFDPCQRISIMTARKISSSAMAIQSP